MLVAGKRYEWESSNGIRRDGLFTGEYDEHNGNALFMAKNGDTWSVPEKDVWLKKK